MDFLAMQRAAHLRLEEQSAPEIQKIIDFVQGEQLEQAQSPQLLLRTAYRQDTPICHTPMQLQCEDGFFVVPVCVEGSK